MSAQIEAYERRNGLPAGGIRLLAGVETARGLSISKKLPAPMRAWKPSSSAARILPPACGATRTPEATELLYARLAVVTACAAFDLQAIDIVTIDFRNPEIVRAEAEFGARLGFAGKQIIHPSQVEPVQTAFTPSDEAIAYARRVVETFEAHQGEGKGAYELDGKMIDLPLLKNAQKVLARRGQRANWYNLPAMFEMVSPEPVDYLVIGHITVDKTPAWTGHSAVRRFILPSPPGRWACVWASSPRGETSCRSTRWPAFRW